MKYVLASRSPRRRQLLEQIGITEFEVLPSDCEEIITSSIPHCVVRELSEQKALASAQKLLTRTDSASLAPGYVLISADTVVADHQQILGKPRNEADALTMLTHLRGHAHSVFTGVTILRIAQGRILRQSTFHDETKVYMRSYSEQEMRLYIDSKEPLDKAGAYGIQGLGAILVERIEGDYNNVVGLPVSHLYQELKQIL